MVCVFARKTSAPLTSLVKQIDAQIKENKKLKSFVVVLSDEGDKAADELTKLAQEAGIEHVPLTIHDDVAGPSSYNLAKDAEITVVMWRGHRVQVNHAFKGELTEENIKTIMAGIPTVLGK